jgi:hypothetical protein
MIPSFSTNWRGVGSNEEAILRDAVQLGDRFGVPLRTAVRVHADPAEAILQQLRIGEHAQFDHHGRQPPAPDHSVLWGRGSGGAEAIPSVHLVGR